MNVKKFTASSSRDALRKVREALGPDAVILSNRNIDGGVEILALANDDVSALADAQPEPMSAPEPAQVFFSPKRQTASEMEELARRRIEAEQEMALRQRMEMEQEVIPKRRTMEGDQASSLAGAIEQARSASLQRQPEHRAFESGGLDDVMNEIRSMRGMLESQLAEIAWGAQQKREPMRAVIMREMLAAGFSASLSRLLTENLPDDEKPSGGLPWVKTVLERNINAVGNENEILENGGVYALVGPTGVGKTTSTAKLAARCVMRHGSGKLALITTDGYRIGGYEQLRIYGKILGVMVHSVKDEADLRIALNELKNKHTVLIDTVGVSQRDQMVAEQIAMLSGAGTTVKRLLCLSATSTGETLNEVVRAYQGTGLAGCIVTKLDEAATIGNVLDVVIRQKLQMYYVANGQRVPEDLHVVNKQYLIDRAFKLKRETAPFQLQDAELPLVVANTTHAMNDKSLREVLLG